MASPPDRSGRRSSRPRCRPRRRRSSARTRRWGARDSPPSSHRSTSSSPPRSRATSPARSSGSRGAGRSAEPPVGGSRQLDLRLPMMPTDVLARNNVTLVGRGTQPMVFVHGFGCDQQMWRFMTPAFEDDYRIVLFDYVGHGGSDRAAYDPDRYATLDGFAQDILDVVEALDLRDVVLVGHSVSSIVGVLAINRHPEPFERLIMVAPSPRYINDPP